MFEAISYYGNHGVIDTLKQLEKKGYKGIFEDEYLLGLKKNGSTITLEPGSQIEFSIKPYRNLHDIEVEYLELLNDIIPILTAKDQCLLACGYSPTTPISQIKLIPKKRYYIMEKHFIKCGKYAHHMMKGTASLQLNIDFKDEWDYAKKYKIINALSPLFYAMFDNSPRFEGNWYEKYCIRTKIWNNCDNNRCGILPSVFDDNYGYHHYAEYILNHSPIFINDKIVNVPFKDIFNPQNYSIETLEHVLSMFFPDVRTKKFIELRMIDSLPYPFNFAVVALFKGLLYHENNLNTLYDFIQAITYQDVLKAKRDIISTGIHTTIKNYKMTELMKWLYQLAQQGLDASEQSYLNPLAYFIQNQLTPMKSIQQKDDLQKTLEWSMIHHRRRGGHFGHSKGIY